MMMIILSKSSTTLGCHKYFLPKNHKMKKMVDHPQLETMLGFLLVEVTYLQAAMVANLLVLVITIRWEMTIVDL
jgi:hypothetical protein